jgi:hypothetical protein
VALTSDTNLWPKQAALDTTYGNVTEAEAERLGLASMQPVAPSVGDLANHHPGSTEPWISRLVGDFIVARGARTVLETGCFEGATSAYLYDALRRLGRGLLVCCDIDERRRETTYDRLGGMHREDVGVDIIMCGDVIPLLQKDRTRYDLAWVDDCHEKPHVTKELTLLYPKMNPGGLILLHDVFGVCDLQSVVRQFGGYSIDLPRLGPAGGLGIIQCP